MRSVFLMCLLLLCCIFSLHAQYKPACYIEVNIDDLYSTHSTHFPGLSAGINRKVGKVWDLGISAGAAYTPSHPDNGWEIKHLLLIPVYVNQYLNFSREKRINPFLHLEEGITLSNYNRSDAVGTPFYHVREAGFYGYFGAGICSDNRKKIGCKMEAGLKGYKLSFNNLDINPHGFAMSLGLRYRLS